MNFRDSHVFQGFRLRSLTDFRRGLRPQAKARAFLEAERAFKAQRIREQTKVV